LFFAQGSQDSHVKPLLTMQFPIGDLDVAGTAEAVTFVVYMLAFIYMVLKALQAKVCISGRAKRKIH